MFAQHSRKPSVPPLSVSCWINTDTLISQLAQLVMCSVTAASVVTSPESTGEEGLVNPVPAVRRKACVCFVLFGFVSLVAILVNRPPF